MRNDDILAAQIRTALEKQKGGLDQWRAATLELSALFAEGRAMHESDQAFGRWLVDNDLDEVGRDDRAAYIKLGRDVERARDLLRDADRLVSADTLARRISVSGLPKPTPPAPSPVETSETAAKPAVPSELAVAKERAATSPKGRNRAPRIVSLIGEDDGRPIFDLLGKSSTTLRMLVDIAEMKGGKAAAREYALTLRDHPAWSPVRAASVLTVRVLNDAYGRDAIELPQTPAGLRKAISLALEEEKRAQEPSRPSLIDARGLVFVTDKEVSTAKIEPFERPSIDAEIAVYGTVIRRAGEHIEHYQEAWAAVRFMEMIEGAGRRPDPEAVEGRAGAYRAATHYLRCGASQMFCHYWQQIALAMSRPVDRNAGIQLAPAMRRAA